MRCVSTALKCSVGELQQPEGSRMRADGAALDLTDTIYYLGYFIAGHGGFVEN